MSLSIIHVPFLSVSPEYQKPSDYRLFVKEQRKEFLNLSYWSRQHMPTQQKCNKVSISRFSRSRPIAHRPRDKWSNFRGRNSTLTCLLPMVKEGCFNRRFGTVISVANERKECRKTPTLKRLNETPRVVIRT